MGKRYGRNQKRKHRLVIEQLQKLTQEQHDLIETQANLIEGVRRTLGAYTAALPPRFFPGAFNGKEAPRQIGLSYLAAHSPEGYRSASACVVEVATLLTSKAHVDWMQDKVHFFVHLEDRVTAYAASYSALREIPISALSEHAGEIIARPVVRAVIQAFRNDR